MSIYNRFEKDLEAFKITIDKGKFSIGYKKRMDNLLDTMNEIVKGVKRKHELILKVETQAIRNEKELLAARDFLKEKGLLEEFNKQHTKEIQEIR